ncbi:hypothetical protein [Chitiniphilus eburneus]|uniref:hypothetical protein n=1 Tax=Chitiniphilus eburneus TaxID=2571148 RepID=UPI0035D0CA97
MKTYDLSGAAGYLYIHENTLAEIAGRGEIDGAAKIGRAWVFLEDGLVDYIRRIAAEQNAKRRVECQARQQGKPAANDPTAGAFVATPTATRRGRQARIAPDLSRFTNI